MATEAQIEANRRNASKSTGPNTQNGKARAKLNALKHGQRAKTVMPVLPHEDPRELAARIQEWTEDLRPRNASERELVSRAARLSFVLERAERAETAHLARRVRKATQARPSARRLERVADLGRKLLYDPGPRSFGRKEPTWDDNPAVFLRGLEETPEGCQWLLDRWQEIRYLQDCPALWSRADQLRFVRLLGKKGVEAINDPELNRIFVAWEMIQEGAGRKFWKLCWESSSMQDPGMSVHQLWREIVPRPADYPGAQQVLENVIDEQIRRVKELLEEHAALAEAEASELADRAAFDPSPALDRLRRYQTARGRELLRTIDVLMKMQRQEFGEFVGQETNPVGIDAFVRQDSDPVIPNLIDDKIETLADEGGTRAAQECELDPGLHEPSDRRRQSQKTPNEANSSVTQLQDTQRLEHEGQEMARRERSQSGEPSDAGLGVKDKRSRKLRERVPAGDDRDRPERRAHRLARAGNAAAVPR